MATIDIATLSTELDTDARTTRKFLRSITPADSQPGKGSRWAIEKREVRSLKSKFSKYLAEAAQVTADREAAKATAATKVDEVEDLDTDPTDEDLAMIEEDASIDANED